MTALADNTLFRFEEDFAGSLRCIPMCVRLKLDLTGIKLSLRQWSQFGAQARRHLLDLPCATFHHQQLYRDTLIALIGQHCDEPPRDLALNDEPLWQATSAVPSCVMGQAAADRVSPPTTAAWCALSPLQRFALVKLARSRHENENFVPALREFGLLEPV